jgi:ABC transport system ATP-binding/permease protein
LAKEGLRRLLAAGATTPEEAHALVSRVTRMARIGTRLEVETMVIWPEGDEDARPASEFFVNERIDLLVREAETFRNDYRNQGERRNVFLALRKPVPFGLGETAPADQGEVDTANFANDPAWGVETQQYCAAILLGIVLGSGVISTLIISRQNRLTR